MAFLIKKWAKMNSLFGGSNKRFNSYSLTLLVIQFLQSGVRPAVLPYLNKEYPDLFKNNPDVKNLEVDKDLNVQFGQFCC
jgi:poly(A) RNA polymerase GLD2